MIKLILMEEREEFNFDFDDSDEDSKIFPEKYVEVTFGDEDNLITIFREIVKLLKYDGYIITKKHWDDIGSKLEKDKDFSNLSLDNLLIGDEEE